MKTHVNLMFPLMAHLTGSVLSKSVASLSSGMVSFAVTFDPR
jgi:hypothetical protein